MSDTQIAPLSDSSDASARKPLARWSYPFVMGASAIDMNGGIVSLGRGLGGNFPLAANGLIHGGIHFDEGTGGTIRQDDGVQVIADGEIVAYRLDDRYPRLHYHDGQKLLYSSSFVLVRHKLALPRAKGASPASVNSADGKSESGDTLYFFSLYMHLQDWKGYEKTAAGDTTPNGAAKARHMPFWTGSARYRVGEKAKDQQIRPKVRANAVGAPANGSGAASLQRDASSRDDAPLEIRSGIRVRATPGGEILALIPHGTEFSAKDCVTKGWVKLNDIADHWVLPSVVGGKTDPRAANGFVYADELDKMIVPSPLDSVVVLDKPYPIKAGQLPGYVGECQAYCDASPLPAKPKCAVLHLEVFAGDALRGFLEKSRAYARTAKGEDKTRLRVAAGARLVSRSDADQQIDAGLLLQATKDSPSSGAWAKVQPMRARPRGSSAARRPMQGPPLWVERRLSNTTTDAATKAWSVFPLQAAKQNEDAVAFEQMFSRDQLENQADADKAQDDKGVCWWRVAAGGVSTHNIFGWVCEAGHAGTHWESPWAWPGFNLVDQAKVSMVDLFKRGCYVRNNLFRDEADAFKAIAGVLRDSPLIEQVERAIGQRERLKGSVSREDLSVAMRKPWFAANLSRLIVRYENEWGGEMAKWEALSEHMRGKTRIWEAEMSRIKRLHWWSDVESVASFPTSSVVYHIHPLGLVENFIKQKCRCIQYEAIYAERGPAYRDSQIKSNSYYALPIDRSPGRLAGESRRHGDAVQLVQRKVIDMLVDAGRSYGLARGDLLLLLAIARVESGFNPDAAAGTTSASGIGQFTDDTSRSYGIFEIADRFDAKQGAIALVRHYLDNKRMASRRYVGRELEIMIYALHHDGPSLRYGGREVSISKVMPLRDLFEKSVCEQVME